MKRAMSLRKMIRMARIVLMMMLIMLAKAKMEGHQGFEDLGQVAASLSYAHLNTFIEFESVTASVKQVGDMADAIYGKSQDALGETEKPEHKWMIGKRHFEWFGRFNGNLHRLDKRVQKVISLFKPIQTHQKEKRQIFGLLGLASGGVGFGFSLCNKVKINQLERMVGETNNALVRYVDSADHRMKISEKNIERLWFKVDRLINVTAAIEADTIFHEIHGELEYHLVRVTEKVDMWEQGLISLLHGTVSPILFDPDVLYGEIKKLQERLKSKSQELLHHTPADIFRFEISTLVSGDGVRVFIHVPVASGGGMKVYRMMPTPFYDKKGGVIYTFDTEKTVLAISEDHTRSFAMTVSDLNRCRRVSDLHYCEGQQVANRHPEDTCVGAVFTGHKENIRNKCHIQISMAGEELQVLNQTSFIVMSKAGSTRVYSSCEDAAKIVENGEVVTLEPTCSAFTDNHWFGATGDISSTKDIVMSPIVFNEEVIGLDHFSSSEVIDTLNQLRQQDTLKTFRVQDVKVAMTESRRWKASMIGSTVTFCIGTTGLIAALCILFWICKSAKKCEKIKYKVISLKSQDDSGEKDAEQNDGEQ